MESTHQKIAFNIRSMFFYLIMITTLMNNWLAVPKIDKMKNADGYVKPMKTETVLLNTTSQYAEKSTAHGISYIFEDGRLPAERFLWTIIVIAGLSFR